MGYFAHVRIWESVPAFSRQSRYEIPLAAALRSHRLGEVVGAGSQMNRELEVEIGEIDLHLDNLDTAVDMVKLVLEQAGAPAGSEIRLESEGVEKIIPIGRVEGLAIYLDGINLPDAVYDTCSCDGLAALINGALTSVGGEIRGSWVGRNETAIYMYGPDAETMFATIEPFLKAYPLCQNSRVVIRHGNPDRNPRTVRFPFHDSDGQAKPVFWGGQTGTG